MKTKSLSAFLTLLLPLFLLAAEPPLIRNAMSTNSSVSVPFALDVPQWNGTAWVFVPMSSGSGITNGQDNVSLNAANDTTNTFGGLLTILGTRVQSDSTDASGVYSHAEGASTVASGAYSHAEGAVTTASGVYAHAEGLSTVASGDASHAEGAGTLASGMYAHAEGAGSQATNFFSFVWSDGPAQGSDSNGTFTVRASAIRLYGGPIYGDGSGLSNLPGGGGAPTTNLIVSLSSTNGYFIYTVTAGGNTNAFFVLTNAPGGTVFSFGSNQFSGKLNLGQVDPQPSSTAQTNITSAQVLDFTAAAASVALANAGTNLMVTPTVGTNLTATFVTNANGTVTATVSGLTTAQLNTLLGLASIPATNIVGILPAGTLTLDTTNNNMLPVYYMGTDGLQHLTNAPSISAANMSGIPAPAGVVTNGGGLGVLLVATGVGINPTNAVSLVTSNATDAVNGTQQYAPAWIMTGHGYATTPAASVPYSWRISSDVVQAATPSAFTGNLYFGYQFTNGGAFANQMSLSAAGTLTAATTVTSILVATPLIRGINSGTLTVCSAITPSIVVLATNFSSGALNNNFTNGISSYSSNTLALTSISFPASDVKWTNTFGRNIFLFIDNAGVTGTAVKINNTQISSTLLVTGDTMLPLHPGEYFSETYTLGTPVGVWKPE